MHGIIQGTNEMKPLLRIASVSAIVVLAFAVGGVFANLFFYYFPNIYASSGIFSVGFVAVSAAIVKFLGGLGGLIDFIDWFH